jgi:hypothetical protein
MELDVDKLLKFSVFIISLFMVMWPDDKIKNK